MIDMSLLDDNFEKDYAKNVILGSLCEAYSVDNKEYKIEHIYQYLNGNMRDVNYDDILSEANDWLIYYIFYLDEDLNELAIFLFCKRDVNVKEVPRIQRRNWYGGMLSIKEVICRYGIVR